MCICVFMRVCLCIQIKRGFWQMQLSREVDNMDLFSPSAPEDPSEFLAEL